MMRSSQAAARGPITWFLRCLKLGLLAPVLASGCQVAFGDFDVDSSKLVVTCKPNGARCFRGRIQLCSQGNDWREEGDCGTGALCNLATLKCEQCQPGSFQCSDKELQRCSDDRQWVKQDTCVTASLCEVAEDGKQGRCLPSGCDQPRMHRCVGAQLERCPLDQTGWQSVERCATDALCDAAKADLQLASGQPATCQLPTCNPGQSDCQTGSPRPCKANRTGWGDALTVCAAGSCNLEKGDCSACTADAYSCSGPVLHRCGPDLTWTEVQRCASTQLCSASEQACGESAMCTPGEFRCSDVRLQRCRSDGAVWDDVEVCANEALCDPRATRCGVARCSSATATRCANQQYQRCRDNLTGWDPVRTCEAGQLCEPVPVNDDVVPGAERTCVASGCASGTFRCNDVDLEQCSDGAWQKIDGCATRQLCEATLKQPFDPSANMGQRECLAPLCELGELRCETGPVRSVRCTPGRDAFTEIETCNGTLICNPDTKRCEEG